MIRGFNPTTLLRGSRGKVLAASALAAIVVYFVFASRAAAPVELNPQRANLQPPPAVLPPSSTLNDNVVDKQARASTDSLFDSLLRPFLYEAQKRREDRARKDPEFAKRIDEELNEGRVNFLLFGYGETHEPPATERAIIGSDTIISYDTRARSVTLISFTHDIRAPEIEQELKQRGQKVSALKIDQAYNVGGFRLMRKVVEDATGLSIDFQVTFKDTVIQNLVDNVFGGVEVDVPAAFEVHPFYLDGKKYEAGQFQKGKQILNGRQVIQFIKTVPITQGYYGKSLEHNARKHLIFEALLESLNKQSAERGFWIRGSAFLAGELVTGNIVYDFDPIPFAVNNIGGTLPNLGRYLAARTSSGINLPKISKTTYVADPSNGDGGVRWADGDVNNPFTKRDLESGVYPAGAGLTIPYDANANGDLITEYWPSVRSLVKNTLMDRGP